MKKHPPYFENLHPPFIKGDASYGYIYIYIYILTKRNEKCTQPYKKVVPSDSKWTWSNVNLGYGKVTIQL